MGRQSGQCTLDLMDPQVGVHYLWVSVPSQASVPSAHAYEKGTHSIPVISVLQLTPEAMSPLSKTLHYYASIAHPAGDPYRFLYDP